ncbi:MAG: pyrroline-5-carboxylate reductase [Butyribacter sp.]|nr:pyrroline-5-carboxylate reductase [bacterium]MDY3853782.1 pyrroline-5-carboxylate reductase [Butyribacter sp.]
MQLGFIGAGNMAQAMIGGVLESGLIGADNIIASAATKATTERVKEQFHIHTTLDNREVAQADIIVLAVKPVYCEQVLEEIKSEVSDKQIVISIAAGKSMSWLEDMLGVDKKIVRTMPNTPALVGEGITAVCPNRNITEDDLKKVCDILESFGKAEVISESMMDAVIAVSGSSPAYVFMFIEAMADAAVAEGMPRAQAYRFAAQSVLGSARMVLETQKHPGELKDMVCSPAGTTIEAVRALEETGFRGSVMTAMKACADKSRNM